MRAGTLARRALPSAVSSFAKTVGVSLSNSGATAAPLDGIRLTNNNTGKATLANSARIEARRGIALFNDRDTNAGGAEIVDSGGVAADGAAGTLEDWDLPHGIYLANGGAGAATVANSGAVTSADADGVRLSQGGTGAATLRNGGAVKAKTSGIHVWNGGAGSTRIVNAGAVTADGAFSRWGAGDLDSTGIRVSEPGAGDLAIDNSANITADNYGVFARKEGAGGSVTVVHRSGDIVGKGNAGIAAIVGRWRDEGSAAAPAPTSAADVRVDVRGGSITATETRGKVAIAAENAEEGSAIVMISRGAMVTAAHNVGVYAEYAETADKAHGRVEVRRLALSREVASRLG